MLKYIIKRIGTMCITLFVLSLLLFFIIRHISENSVLLSIPSYTKPNQYEAVYQSTTQLLSFDQPWYIQYLSWMASLLEGDFGYSTAFHKPVVDVLASPLKNTLMVNILSFGFAFCLSSCMALYCVFHPKSFWKHLFHTLSLLFLSMPMFLFALFFLYVFAFRLSLFPSMVITTSPSLFAYISAYMFPVICLTLYLSAPMFRYFYQLFETQMSSMHILSCYARGYSSKRIAKHVFSSTALPIVTLCAQQIPSMLFGSFLLENIFSFHGLGRVLFLALEKRDLFLTLTLNFLYAILFLVCMLICEMIYHKLDPRVKV